MRNYFMFSKVNPKPICEWENSEAWRNTVDREFDKVFRGLDNKRKPSRS